MLEGYGQVEQIYEKATPIINSQIIESHPPPQEQSSSQLSLPEAFAMERLHQRYKELLEETKELESTLNISQVQTKLDQQTIQLGYETAPIDYTALEARVTRLEHLYAPQLHYLTETGMQEIQVKCKQLIQDSNQIQVTETGKLHSLYHLWTMFDPQQVLQLTRRLQSLEKLHQEAAVAGIKMEKMQSTIEKQSILIASLEKGIQALKQNFNLP